MSKYVKKSGTEQRREKRNRGTLVHVSAPLKYETNGFVSKNLHAVYPGNTARRKKEKDPVRVPRNRVQQ